ncbi:MAG: hypothetical protein U1E76_09920 [Planctomycetota bacterium]
MLREDVDLERVLDQLTDAAGLKVAEFYGGDDAHPDLKDDMRKALKGVLRRNMIVSDSFPALPREIPREPRGAAETVDPGSQ